MWAIETSIAANSRRVRLMMKSRLRRSQRQRRARLPLGACLAALIWLAGFGAPAAGTVAPDLALAHIPQILARIPQMSWQPPQAIRAFGLPMTWRGMRSGLALPQAARALAEHTGVLRQVWAMPRRVVLAGSHGDTHWVAELVATGRGSAGVVSSMPIDVPGLQRAVDARDALRMEWMPPQAHLRSSHASGEPGRRVRQQVYAAPWPPAELRVQVAERLRARGWLRAAAGNIPKAAQSEVVRAWRKSGQRLLLTFVPLAGGSAVYVRLDTDPEGS
jgi:hypothetical protein